MAVNLLIKNVDDRVAERLRQREARNYRSLQGELLAIIGEQADAEPQLTREQILHEVRRWGLHTPRESLKMIRADRCARYCKRELPWIWTRFSHSPSAND